MASFLSGCLITNPVEFEQEEPVPPVILDVAGSDNPIGSILTVDVVNEPGRIEIPVRIRDENLFENLEARTRVVTALNLEPDFDPAPIPEQGALLREYTVRVETVQLKEETCYQLELVVSGSFLTGMNDPELFDVVSVADDIARASWTIWDVSNDPFGDTSGEAAKKLLDSCPTEEARVVEGMEPAP